MEQTLGMPCVMGVFNAIEQCWLMQTKTGYRCWKSDEMKKNERRFTVFSAIAEC